MSDSPSPSTRTKLQFINASHVRKFALEYASQNRAKKFTRVSANFLEDIDAQVRNIIARKVHSQPSVGHTLQ